MKLMPQRGRRLRRLLKFFFTAIGVAVTGGVLLLDLAVLSVCWTSVAAEERASWLVEYRQIRRAIEETYPNLEWTLAKGELNLAALDRDTTARIESATTRSEAERAMRSFVDAFGDGHLSLQPRRTPDWEVEKRKVYALSRSTSPETACATLGYDGWRAYSLPFDFSNLAPFKRFTDANAFDAGVLTLDGRRVGIVRVASFDDDSYRRTCRDEWSKLRLTLDTTCERECRSRVKKAVRNRLILHFESRIRQLHAAGVELVVLDLTENPGGYGWYEPLGTILTGRICPNRRHRLFADPIRSRSSTVTWPGSTAPRLSARSRPREGGFSKDSIANSTPHEPRLSRLAIAEMSGRKMARRRSARS